jgi:hypothetical protein
MCQFCPEIVAYRVDENKNLIPIYAEEPEDEQDEAEAADAIEQRMAKILAEHRGEMPPGLSSKPPLA